MCSGWLRARVEFGSGWVRFGLVSYVGFRLCVGSDVTVTQKLWVCKTSNLG